MQRLMNPGGTSLGEELLDLLPRAYAPVPQSGDERANYDEAQRVLTFAAVVGSVTFGALGGLAAQEAAGGHLLARHVGKTVTDLAARLITEPGSPQLLPSRR
jgi:hypothetical protein